MSVIIPISFIDDNKKSKKDDIIEVNFNNFLNENMVITEEYIPDTTVKKKSKPKKKTKTKKMSDGNEMIKADGELLHYQTNEPYIDTYDDTNALLKTTISQIDVVSNEIKSDIDVIRNSKALKNKYVYLPDLTNTLSSLLNTKVTAIRELNKTLTDTHNLELKRVKELKMTLANEGNDDKYIMDMYNAFISAPMGNNVPQLAPPMSDLTMHSDIKNIIRSDIGEDDYTGYVQNLTPVQNAMRYELNPDVSQVIVYDQSSGRRYFDVMNIRTGESIPNVPRPDPMFLEDCILDINNRIAKNNNLNKTYPIVLVGDNVSKY